MLPFCLFCNETRRDRKARKARANKNIPIYRYIRKTLAPLGPVNDLVGLVSILTQNANVQWITGPVAYRPHAERRSRQYLIQRVDPLYTIDKRDKERQEHVVVVDHRDRIAVSKEHADQLVRCDAKIVIRKPIEFDAELFRQTSEIRAW